MIAPPYLWLSNESSPIIKARDWAVYGAVNGALLGLIFQKAFPGGPLIQARYFAVSHGVLGGSLSVMERLGKDEIQSRMVSTFGTGTTYALVQGLRGLPMVTTGLALAVTFEATCKAIQMFDSRSPTPVSKARKV